MKSFKQRVARLKDHWEDLKDCEIPERIKCCGMTLDARENSAGGFEYQSEQCYTVYLSDGKTSQTPRFTVSYDHGWRGYVYLPEFDEHVEPGVPYWDRAKTPQGAARILESKLRELHVKLSSLFDGTEQES